MLVLDRARSNSLNCRIADQNNAASFVVQHAQTYSPSASQVRSPRPSIRCIGCPALPALPRGGQIPIVVCGPAPAPYARFRPLQFFGRRPRACGTACVRPASEKLNINRSFQSEQISSAAGKSGLSQMSMLGSGARHRESSNSPAPAAVPCPGHLWRRDWGHPAQASRRGETQVRNFRTSAA
jgi:hypothetical protein